MQRSVNIPKRMTARKVFQYLAAITALGTLGVFLLGAIASSHFFEQANKLTYRQFFQWKTLGVTMLFSFIGMVGVGFTFAANKLGDELWDGLRHRKEVQL